MKQRQILRLIFIIILTSAAVWVVLPNNPGIHLGNLDRDIEVVSGLDLQGGLRVILQADFPEDVMISSENINDARNIIENRLKRLGVADPPVQVLGSSQILVELPNTSDPDQVIATIKEIGLLEFIEIDPSDLVYLQEDVSIITDFGRIGPEPAQETVTPIASDTPESEPSPTITPTTVEDASEAEPTPTIEAPPADVEISPTTDQKVFHTVMTNDHVDSASSSQDRDGNTFISFLLTEEGTQIFGNYTSAHVGDILGVILDKRVISAPRISQAITEGNAIIPVLLSLEQANNLAAQIQFGPLPMPLMVVESKAIGPVLGEDSLQKSAIAGLIGMGFIMIFMVLYYRLPGVLASLILLVYATITLAMFKLIPVTLTLPGVAGFGLSIGIAVDAYVLIFERLKEELRNERSMNQAIDLGFSLAWPSIRDSNILTLIICAVLYWFGNTFEASIVRGFSITLTLGVLINLFTVITVSREFLHLILDNINVIDHPRWFGI